ncbi:hypothetical protein BOTBODRAFT_385236 [Botryobasidium botryosum FD-172 SS1]|uniref:Secreted protein n=1 Tax=Botryobasidium botryosum (strain FD-172 SS1) TaxID=930990 RepID=A0A067N7D2_BOTB1|nr:hypothetical protein BOTBODRAFT_385236 [Botryobasidium botryosum FD-172 SS1]
MQKRCHHQCRSLLIPFVRALTTNALAVRCVIAGHRQPPGLSGERAPLFHIASDITVTIVAHWLPTPRRTSCLSFDTAIVPPLPRKLSPPRRFPRRRRVQEILLPRTLPRKRRPLKVSPI